MTTNYRMVVIWKIPFLPRKKKIVPLKLTIWILEHHFGFCMVRWIHFDWEFNLFDQMRCNRMSASFKSIFMFSCIMTSYNRFPWFWVFFSMPAILVTFFFCVFRYIDFIFMRIFSKTTTKYQMVAMMLRFRLLKRQSDQSCKHETPINCRKEVKRFPVFFFIIIFFLFSVQCTVHPMKILFSKKNEEKYNFCKSTFRGNACQRNTQMYYYYYD